MILKFIKVNLEHFKNKKTLANCLILDDSVKLKLYGLANSLILESYELKVHAHLRPCPPKNN